MDIDTAITREIGSVPPAGTLDIGALLDEERRVRVLHRQRHAAIHRLQSWIREVEEDRQRLLTARREARALARLRERRYLEFVCEVLRDEGERIEESRSIRHERRKRAA